MKSQLNMLSTLIVYYFLTGTNIYFSLTFFLCNFEKFSSIQKCAFVAISINSFNDLYFWSIFNEFNSQLISNI